MKKKILATLAALSLFSLAGCQSSQAEEHLKIGVVGDASADIWEEVADKVADQGVDLEVVTFSDYVQPNRALADGDIDLNAFQHLAFLKEYVEDSGDDFVPVGYTAISPTFVFAVEGIDSPEDIPEGASVAIPNTVTNAERSFLALQDLGLLELDPEAGSAPTVDDIEEVKHGLEIVELDPQQVARALGDTDLAIIGSQQTVDADYDPQDAIYNDVEDSDREVDPLKKNAIVTLRDRQDDPAILKVVDAYQSDDISQLVVDVTADLVAWEEGDDPIGDFDRALEEDR